jgi:hypothetical protein
MEVKGSEAQGRSGDGRSEGSAEQKREPMNKNRIRGIRCRARWQMTAKPISIKGTGCRSGGCAQKVVGLTPGDLPFVLETGLSSERSMLSKRQKSAEGIVAAKRSKAAKARTEGKASRRRDA